MCFTECFDQHVGEQMKQVKHIFLYYFSCQKHLCVLEILWLLLMRKLLSLI